MSDGLQSEAIREIERLTRESDRVHMLHVSNEPSDVYLTEYNGVITRHVAERPRCYTIKTPEEFVRFASEQEDDNKIVFYSENNLEFYYDENERREGAFCNLSFSDQFKWLRERSESRLSQRELIRELRITFRGCNAEGLLSLVRQLKWSAVNDGEANLQHGRESLGRSVEARVSSSDNLPEDVRLDIPIWNEFRVRAVVACALEVFPQEQVFKLTPFPQELDSALDLGLKSLEQLLNVPELPAVYRGKA